MNRIAVFGLFIVLCVFLTSTFPATAIGAGKVTKASKKSTKATATATPTPTPTPTPIAAPVATPASTSAPGPEVSSVNPPQPTATPKGSRAPIDSNNVVRINYGNAGWNKNPAAIDSASILMREGTTGRTVQIHLEEDAPDSSVFSGLFSINWHNIDKLQVEFYTPPPELLDSVEGMKKIRAMIDSKELHRKPFLLRRGDTRLQTVEIFDTVEQAQAALKAYRNEIQLESIQGLKNKSYPSNEEIDISKLTETNEQRAEAAAALADRVRMYQIEVHRLQDLTTKFMALKIPVRDAHRKQAAALIAEGVALFTKDNFEDALAKYEQAIEIDPQNRIALYQYAVTLYRMLDYNRSIVYLQLAEGEGVNEAERQYYLALNYYAIKDYDNATASFEKVIASKSPTLAPSAQFYVGVVKYDAKDWEPAQKAFQTVLDTSSDSQLDKQAETYIEYILRSRQFETERAKKWTLTATIGEIADSNVLLSSGSALDLGTASDSFGYRTLLMGSARYRPIYNEENEFAIEASVLDLYTVDKTISPTQALRNSDPTVLTLMAPWSLKSILFGHGYKLDLMPGYERIYMSIEDNTSKAIVSSLLLNINNLFVMSPDWFANWNIETRKDNSGLDSSKGTSDANAIKVKFLNANTFILNNAKNKFATAEIGYTMNQAIGSEVTYNRIDLSAGYLQPFYWDTVANAKLNLYLLNYTGSTLGRVDTDYALSLGGSKKINERLTAGLMYAYTVNDSNVALDAYRKWTLMATLSAVFGL